MVIRLLDDHTYCVLTHLGAFEKAEQLFMASLHKCAILAVFVDHWLAAFGNDDFSPSSSILGVSGDVEVGIGPFYSPLVGSY